MKLISTFLLLLSIISTNAEELLFSCAKWNIVDTSNVYFFDGKKYQALGVPSSSKSKTYKCNLNPEEGSRLLHFFSLQIDDEGNEFYSIVGKGILPHDTSRVLVIFDKSEEKSMLKVSILDDSLTKYPSGSFRIINYTKEPLRVIFNSLNEVIKERSEMIAKPNIGNNGAFVPFELYTAKGYRCFATKLLGTKHKRNIVFVRPNSTNNHKVKLKFLSETIRPQAEIN